MYINVKLIHLGKGVREVVVENEDGGHTVFIEDQLSGSAQRDAYRHALKHIRENDFGKFGDVGDIERETHESA